jgi:hypothetical protein
MTGVLSDFSAVLVCVLLANDCPQRVEGPRCEHQDLESVSG